MCRSIKLGHAFIWTYSVLSDLHRVRSSEVVCEPSFTQLSLPFPLLPLSSSASAFCCHPLSPLLAPFLPWSLLLMPPLPLLLCPFFPRPPSCLHLLSQGPCGTLRGWWGWGWWWCRWWWNSHSVSSLSVLELEASPNSSFPIFPSLVSEERLRRKTRS